MTRDEQLAIEREVTRLYREAIALYENNGYPGHLACMAVDNIWSVNGLMDGECPYELQLERAERCLADVSDDIQGLHVGVAELVKPDLAKQTRMIGALMGWSPGPPGCGHGGVR